MIPSSPSTTSLDELRAFITLNGRALALDDTPARSSVDWGTPPATPRMALTIIVHDDIEPRFTSPLPLASAYPGTPFHPALVSPVARGYFC